MTIKSSRSSGQEISVYQPALPSALRGGPAVGILLVLQLAAALIFPFILAKPITLGSPAFLSSVAAQASQIRSAVLLSFVGAGLTVALGIRMFRVFRHHCLSVAQLFLVACAISCTLDLVHASTILSMLSISSHFTISSAADAGLYGVVGAAVASARRSAHTIQLVAIGAWMFLFYLSLFRFRLLPRSLALLGVLGVLLQFTGVTLLMLLGYASIGELAMPLLPIHLTVAVWLMAKGFQNEASMQHHRDHEG